MNFPKKSKDFIIFLFENYAAWFNQYVSRIFNHNNDIYCDYWAPISRFASKTQIYQRAICSFGEIYLCKGLLNLMTSSPVVTGLAHEYSSEGNVPSYKYIENIKNHEPVARVVTRTFLA